MPLTRPPAWLHDPPPLFPCRYALRRARPCRESVQDDVEAALSREIAHLNAVTSQLSDKVG
jgi:hypothetical protein